VPKGERKGRSVAKRDSGKAEKPAPLWSVVRAFGWNHKDAIGGGIAAVAVGAILINGLFLQNGPHPAPMFKGDKLVTVPATVASGSSPAAANARARPAEPSPAKPATATATATPARPTGEIVADIQRELARRGFYDGVVDGRYGPRTDTAIRDFEQSSGFKASSEPSEALLQSIKRWNPKAAKTTASIPAAPRPAAQPVRSDPIAEVLAPSKRVVAVQRALAEFGYGQIKPTGVIDVETKAAIEKFERERKLPVTGQVSDRFARELASITGRPLD
jgi:peptidoglycan hydrolase-like protein with peptidoglycan-binding domain